MKKEIWKCAEQGDVFIDALACDVNMQLLFASIYGRHGSLQQLLSRIHLGIKADGIDRLTAVEAVSGSVSLQAFIGNPGRFEKLSGKLGTRTLFGELAQIWVYDTSITKPDMANRRGWLLFDGSHCESSRQQQIWMMVKQLSPVPLLNHWEAEVTRLLAQYGESGGVRFTRAIGPMVPVQVALPDAFEKMISDGVKLRRLTLSEQPVAAVNLTA